MLLVGCVCWIIRRYRQFSSFSCPTLWHAHWVLTLSKMHVSVSIYSFNILTRPLLLSWLVLALPVRTISYASVRIRIIILCARPSKALRLYLHWYFPRSHNTINFQPCVFCWGVVYSSICLAHLCVVLIVLYVHYLSDRTTTLLTEH